MKRTIFYALPIAAAVLLAGCDQQTASAEDPEAKEVAASETEPAARPAPAAVEAPKGAATAELARQTVGQKLIGNTVMLRDGAFAAADLASAPDYYLVYYSASW